MKHITVAMSAAQAAKLRNGHKVRVKKGCGFSLIVHPERFHLMTRTFDKGRGAEVQLSPEELSVNKLYASVTPEEHAGLSESPDAASQAIVESGAPHAAGTGIFGKKFDRGLKKALGHQLSSVVYKGAEHLREPLKQAIKGGLTAAGAAATAFAPELAPAILMAQGRLGSMSDKYIDDPSKYQHKGGFEDLVMGHGLFGKTQRIMGGLGAGMQFNKSVMSHLRDASHGAHMAGIKSMDMADRAIHSRGGSHTIHDMHEIGGPISRGGGFHHPHAVGHVGHRGGMLAMHYSPAMVSQPLSANFQFQHFLPPQYQAIGSHGGGLYL